MKLLVKFLKDLPNGIKAGTIKPVKAVWAKQLVADGICEYSEGLPKADKPKVSLAKPKPKAKAKAKKK